MQVQVSPLFRLGLGEPPVPSYVEAATSSFFSSEAGMLSPVYVGVFLLMWQCQILVMKKVNFQLR